MHNIAKTYYCIFKVAFEEKDVNTYMAVNLPITP